VSTHVILNRTASRLHEAGPLHRAIVEESARATLHETRSMDDLERVTRAIAAQGADAVVLAGGDGSYMAGCTALFRAFESASAPLPRLAFAPGGTVSTVARNWGLRGSLVPYTRRLLRAVIDGRAVETLRPSLRVRDAAGGDRVGFIFGTGLVASFFDVYYQAEVQGYAAAAAIVARIFAGSFVGGALARRVLTPLQCTIAIDGVDAPAPAYGLVVASVVKNLGLHMHVVHRAGEDHERVHLVASPLGAVYLAAQLPLVLAGRRLVGRDHVDALARRFRVTFASDARDGESPEQRRREPGGRDAYVLDGEVLAAPWVEVEAGPRLRVLGA
jgi:diacylglycerol kinase family enzyme